MSLNFPQLKTELFKNNNNRDDPFSMYAKLTLRKYHFKPPDTQMHSRNVRFSEYFPHVLNGCAISKGCKTSTVPDPYQINNSGQGRFEQCLYHHGPKVCLGQCF